MRAAILMLGLGSMLSAGVAQSQVWVGSTTRDASSPQSSTTYVGGSSWNTNAVELVELTGMRKRFEADRTKGMAEAKQDLLRAYPSLTPAFVNEWARRVAAGMNPDDYVAIEAAVYASHFTNDELVELVQARRNVNAGVQSGVPQPLRDKVRRVFPTVVGEIAAGIAQANGKLGAEVMQQVAKEHPEWLKPSAAAGASR